MTAGFWTSTLCCSVILRNEISTALWTTWDRICPFDSGLLYCVSRFNYAYDFGATKSFWAIGHCYSLSYFIYTMRPCSSMYTISALDEPWGFAYCATSMLSACGDPDCWKPSLSISFKYHQSFKFSRGIQWHIEQNFLHLDQSHSAPRVPKHSCRPRFTLS